LGSGIKSWLRILFIFGSEMIIFIWKNGKIYLKMCKTSIFKIFLPCLCNFALPKFRLRIRILPKRSGSCPFSDPKWLFLSEKMEKFTWKCVKPLFLKYFFLVFATLHCQSFGSGSGSYQKRPDPVHFRIRNDYFYLKKGLTGQSLYEEKIVTKVFDSYAILLFQSADTTFFLSFRVLRIHGPRIGCWEPTRPGSFSPDKLSPGE
jgi:hypothetical protein